MYGFSARRTLSAAQRLYEEHKALTYPRTNSRFLTGDMVAEIKPTAELVGHNPQYTQGAEYVLGARAAARSSAWSTTRRSRTTTRSSPPAPSTTWARWARTSCKIYDLVAKRFLAIFHPEAKFERTRVETTVGGARVPDQRPPPRRGRLEGRLRRARPSPSRPRTTPGGDQLLPRLEQGEDVETRSVESMRKETQPPRRYTDASLLGAMETAGKEVDDAEVREAMKDSGIGTPATRASIIERLVSVGYLEREGRALVATEKAIQVVRLLGDHQLTSPELTGDWERRLGLIERARTPGPPSCGTSQVHHRDR